MFEAISRDAERQRFGSGDRAVLGVTVHEHAGERWYFGDPAAVLLAFNLDDQAHAAEGTATPSARRDDSLLTTLTSRRI